MTERLEPPNTALIDEDASASTVVARKHNTERILAVTAILIALISCCLTVPSFFTDAVGLPLGISSLFEKTHPDLTATKVALMNQENAVQQATVLPMQQQFYAFRERSETL